MTRVLKHRELRGNLPVEFDDACALVAKGYWESRLRLSRLSLLV